MLLSRSIGCQFAGILITIAVSLRGIDGREDLPSYDEFYNTRAASAIKEIGSEEGDLVQIATSRILRRAEADQAPDEAKQKQSYQTYEIPRETLAKFSLEGAYEDEIDALDKEYSSPTVYRLDAVKVSDTSKEDPPGNYGGSSGESKKPNKSSFYVTKTKHSKPKKAPKESTEEESYVPKYKVTHYEVSQPVVAQSTDAPYKRYQSYASKPSTSASNDRFQILASENIGSNSNCEEVKKKGNDQDPAMKCVVCKDPKTGTKSQQCSYSSASEPEAYFISKSAKYSQPTKPINQRYKRYTVRDKDFDPYENFKSESQKHFSVDEGDFFKDFKFPSGYFSGDTLEKSESEVHAEKLIKEGGVCKEVKKNDMTCKVCKNEKTGGNFETCSYSSVPTEKKYAFVTEKKSDGNSEPRSKRLESKESKTSEKKFEPRVSESVQEQVKKNRGSVKAKLVDDNPYEVPSHFAEQTKNREEKSDSDRYRSKSDENSDNSHSNDEYYNRIFNNKPAASEEKPSSYSGNNDKKDVEKVLEEFAKKDRSTCKKAVKNGMTCYLCVNKDGTQHEECMYVTGKQPQSSHVAYHEVEQLKNNPSGAASTLREVAVQKRKRPIKKAYSNAQAEPSVKITTTAKFTPAASVGSIVNGKFRQPRKLRRTQNYSGADTIVEETRDQPIVQVKAPKKVSVDSSEASSDRKYVYSKELGVSLPTYFLEKSNYEKSYKS